MSKYIVREIHNSFSIISERFLSLFVSVILAVKVKHRRELVWFCTSALGLVLFHVTLAVIRTKHIKHVDLVLER